MRIYLLGRARAQLFVQLHKKTVLIIDLLFSAFFYSRRDGSLYDARAIVGEGDRQLTCIAENKKKERERGVAASIRSYEIAGEFRRR